MEHLQPHTDAPRLRTILVCGAGLAGQMTVAALSRQLPSSIQITWLKAAGTSDKDMLYGNLAAPSAYDFNLSAGIGEPALILESDTAFSYGRTYDNWGLARRKWVQAFAGPFPVIEGVLLYQFLLQQGGYDLEPYLVSAVAGRAGVFAHPPEDRNHPLSNAEYGYQFDPASYGAVFEGQARNVRKVTGNLAEVHREGDRITGIRLSDGDVLTADLYVDCSGPDAVLAPEASVTAKAGRRLGAISGRSAPVGPGAPLGTLTAGDFGWTARTAVDGAILHLTAFAPEQEAVALQAHGVAVSQAVEVTLGYRDQAWIGNSVALGHAAGIVEPVTCAPFTLLQRDIERLLSLIPVFQEMKVERQAFNRQFIDDYRNAELFNRSLFTGQLPDAPYWREASATPMDERLVCKIEQFESRGLHAAFDLEPFNLEDWVIQHLGLGRHPDRYDRIADHVSRHRIDGYLTHLRNSLQETVKRMPGQDAYRRNLAQYLKNQGNLAS